MKLVPIKPPSRRAKAWGTAGKIVGTTIGALPVKARPGKGKAKATAAKVGAPSVAVLAVLAVVVAKRRRSKAPAPDSWSAPSQDHGTAATVGRPPSADTPPMPQPQAGPTTLTEREKAEATGVDVPGPSDEAAVETAPAAASETPASDVGKAGS